MQTLAISPFDASVRRSDSPYWAARLSYLDQKFPDDLAADVGQAEVAALEAVGQPRVVEAEQVQDRGVQVVDVDLVLDGVEAEVVGLAVG